MTTDTTAKKTTITAPNFNSAATYISNMTTAVYSVMEDVLKTAGVSQSEINAIKNIKSVKTTVTSGVQLAYNIYKGTLRRSQ